MAWYKKANLKLKGNNNEKIFKKHFTFEAFEKFLIHGNSLYEIVGNPEDVFLPDPVAPPTPSEQIDFNNIVNVPLQSSYFCIWAEESTDLTSNRTEWAFGNGNDTPAGMGIIMPFNCKLIALGIMTEGAGSVIVAAQINGVDVVQLATNNSRKELGRISIDITEGDVLGFKTIKGTASSNGGVITAWIERKTALENTVVLN